MTRAAAIKAARGKVDMHRFGRQWCVDVLSEEHRAWWSGRPSTYQSAMRQKRSAIIQHALDMLLPADLPERRDIIDTASCYTEGDIAEVVGAVMAETTGG